MARIGGIQDSDASFLQRFVFRTAAKQVGDVPAPLRIMAKSSGLMWGVGFFEMGFDRATAVPAKMKFLVSLKAASMVGCLF